VPAELHPWLGGNSHGAQADDLRATSVLPGTLNSQLRTGADRGNPTV
jgi:hypothetical protein